MKFTISAIDIESLDRFFEKYSTAIVRDFERRMKIMPISEKERWIVLRQNPEHASETWEMSSFVDDEHARAYAEKRSRESNERCLVVKLHHSYHVETVRNVKARNFGD